MRIVASRKHGAFTRSDLIILVVTSLIFLICVTPALNGIGRRRQRTRCTANLKQIALAHNLWLNDNDLNNYSPIVPESIGGTKQSADRGQIVQSFLAISNQLRTPGVLACPDDKKRKPTASFATLTNVNISYFLAADRNITNQNQLLVGDRDIAVNKTQLPPGMFRVSDPKSISWAGMIHGKNAGNVALIDGSAHQVTDKGLRGLAQFTGSSTNTRLLIP